MRQAVGARGPDVHGDLLLATECREHGKGYAASGAAVEPVARPDRAPCVAGDEVLEGRGELRAALDRAVDVRITEHLAASLDAGVERIVAHRRCSRIRRGLHAVLVFAFLYLPILVVVVLAFNGGRNVLYWEGFSTKWFGAALRNPDIRDSLQTSLTVAALNAVVACVLGTLLALALSRMRARIRVPLDALAYMTLVTPEIVFGIAALIFFVEAGALVGVDSPLGIWTILAAHVVFNASVVALIVRARFVGMGQSFEEASFDLGAGPLATFAR